MVVIICRPFREVGPPWNSQAQTANDSIKSECHVFAISTAVVSVNGKRRYITLS